MSVISRARREEPCFFLELLHDTLKVYIAEIFWEKLFFDV